MSDRNAGTVHVQGVRELRKALRQAGDDMQDLKDANRQAAQIVVARARSLAPSRTGALRASIRAAGTKTAAIVRMGSKRIPYANAVHWGRVWWPNKPQKHHVAVIDENPFVSKAAQQTESTWVPLYETAIDQILDRIQ